MTNQIAEIGYQLTMSQTTFKDTVIAFILVAVLFTVCKVVPKCFRD